MIQALAVAVVVAETCTNLHSVLIVILYHKMFIIQATGQLFSYIILKILSQITKTYQGFYLLIILIETIFSHDNKKHFYLQKKVSWFCCC